MNIAVVNKPFYDEKGFDAYIMDEDHIKCGGKIYSRGINLEDTQEKTAKVVSVLMQQVADTVDAKGLKTRGR